MLDNIRTVFSITDLEKLSGISAHSIRIWERRYNLLQPLRTESNLRRYTNEDLKKLLNISVLLDAGYKISEIASYAEQELKAQVNTLSSGAEDLQIVFNDLKMAMLEFDSRLFEDTLSRLLSTKTFYDVFLDFMIPFLEQIGMLWQTNSITVAHEHYVSNLLRQKLFFQIEHLPKSRTTDAKRYILFLPLGELHELGLLFLYYALLLNNKEVIYLGPDVGHEALDGIPTNEQRVFLSYFTISPELENISQYLADFRKKIMRPGDEFWITGSRVREYSKNKRLKTIQIFENLKELLNFING